MAMGPTGDLQVATDTFYQGKQMHRIPLIRAAASLLLLAPVLSHAQSIQKYFGYYGGDVDNPPSSAISEFKDHVNLYQIINWSGDESSAGREASKQALLSELAKAKASHLHVMIPGWPFLFQGTGSPCFTGDLNASQGWNDLTQDMISQGYLDPQHPDRSVVSAIYLVDEPNLHCMNDVNGTASPILFWAVNTIRANSSTSSLPIASILGVQSTKFSEIRQGMQLFDWVGFDDYGISASQWQSELATLKGYAPTKKLIIVPGAQSAATAGQCVGIDSPNPFIQEMQTDPQAVWLAPFVWFSKQQCLGVRDIPSLRATYTNVGAGIKAQGCASSAAAGNFCKPRPIEPILDLIFND